MYPPTLLIFYAGADQMCYHLLMILMSEFLWGLLKTNALLWQRAYTSYEIAGLLSLCTPHFVSQPVEQAQKSIALNRGGNLKLTPLKAAQRDKSVPKSVDGLFNVIRFNESTLQPQCCYKKCNKKMKQYSVCVSFQCLQQRRHADPPCVCQLYCCLNLTCLNGERNHFTDALPKFNNRFAHIHETLNPEERAGIDACISIVTPSKRSYTSPNQSPIKRARKSSSKSKTP
jgi:hypothetical protein